jgi:hypothetical protein
MTRDELRDRRGDSRSAIRLDRVAIVLLAVLAVLQLVSAVGIPPGSGTPAERSVAAGIGGLVDALVLAVFAFMRLEREAWARPAAVASLLVLIAVTLLGAQRSPTLGLAILTLSCLAVVVIVLQRRGHTAAAALGPRLPVAALATTVFAMGAVLQLVPPS